MDSFALRKFLVRLSLLAGLAALGLLAWWGAECLVRHEEDLRRHGNGCAKVPVQQYVKPTAEELQVYVDMAVEIVKAYSNDQVSVMQELAKSIPKDAYRLRGDDHIKIMSPINRLWFQECRANDRLMDFEAVEEFKHCMGKRMALTKIYGNFIVDSGVTAVDVLVSLDITILKRLQEHRDKFEREGKSEFLSAAERLIAEWIEQIESERGFTREYARSQKIGLWRLVESGEVTEDVLMTNVRIYPLLLKERCGYTPKWLDKEFPVVPAVRGSSK